MKNITTGCKCAAEGVVTGHEDITAVLEARHIRDMGDVILMLLHNGYTLLLMRAGVNPPPRV